MLGERRHKRIQGQPQEHALRGPDGGPAVCRKGVEVWRPRARRASQRTRQWPRKRDYGAASRRHDDQIHRRRDAAAAQRLPPAQETPRVTATASLVSPAGGGYINTHTTELNLSN